MYLSFFHGHTFFVFFWGGPSGSLDAPYLFFFWYYLVTFFGFWLFVLLGFFASLFYFFSFLLFASLLFRPSVLFPFLLSVFFLFFLFVYLLFRFFACLFSFWKTNPWRLLMAFIFNFVGCLSTWLSIVCPMWSKVGSDDGSIRRCNPGSRIFDCVLWTGWSRRDCSFPWMLDIVLPNGRQEMVRWGAVDRDVQSIEFMSCSNSGPTGHVSARASTERKRHDRRVGWEGDQSCCWRGWKKWGAAMATSSRWPGTAGWFSECSEKGKSDLKAGHRGLI